MKVINLFIIYNALLRELDELNSLKRSVLDERSYTESLKDSIEKERKKLEDKCSYIQNLTVDVNIQNEPSNETQPSTHQKEPSFQEKIQKPNSEIKFRDKIEVLPKNNDEPERISSKKNQKVYRY
jgi:hypothetical protein